MNINNNSPISFGLKLHKDLVSSLEDDLSNRNGSSLTCSKRCIGRDLHAKMLMVSSWCDDTFELVETENKVSKKKGFGLKRVGDDNFVMPIKSSSRKSILTRFFVLRKEDVEKCIAGFDEALRKKNAKSVKKQIIKFR